MLRPLLACSVAVLALAGASIATAGAQRLLRSADGRGEHPVSGAVAASAGAGPGTAVAFADDSGRRVGGARARRRQHRLAAARGLGAGRRGARRPGRRDRPRRDRRRVGGARRTAGRPLRGPLRRRRPGRSFSGARRHRRRRLVRGRDAPHRRAAGQHRSRWSSAETTRRGRAASCATRAAHRTARSARPARSAGTASDREIAAAPGGGALLAWGRGPVTRRALEVASAAPRRDAARAGPLRRRPYPAVHACGGARRDRVGGVDAPRQPARRRGSPPHTRRQPGRGRSRPVPRDGRLRRPARRARRRRCACSSAWNARGPGAQPNVGLATAQGTGAALGAPGRLRRGRLQPDLTDPGARPRGTPLVPLHPPDPDDDRGARRRPLRRTRRRARRLCSGRPAASGRPRSRSRAPGSSWRGRRGAAAPRSASIADRARAGRRRRARHAACMNDTQQQRSALVFGARNLGRAVIERCAPTAGPSPRSRARRRRWRPPRRRARSRWRATSPIPRAS